MTTPKFPRWKPAENINELTNEYQVGVTGLHGFARSLPDCTGLLLGCARSLPDCTGLLLGCVRLPNGNYTVQHSTVIDYQAGTANTDIRP